MPHEACRWQQTPEAALQDSGMPGTDAQPGLWGGVDQLNWVRQGKRLASPECLCVLSLERCAFLSLSPSASCPDTFLTTFGRQN